jgi:branched-chain amino acid transport system substrate-binding protein
VLDEVQRGVKVKRHLGIVAVFAAMATIAMGCGSSSHSAAKSGSAPTASPITIGFVTDLTGPAATSFSDSPGGAQARIALQNAAGGIDGHPLKLDIKDDASNPSTNPTAANVLVSNNSAVGIIESSAAFISTAGFNRLSVPIVSWDDIATTTAVQQAFNIFSPLGEGGAFNGKNYAYDLWGPFLKSLDVTKVAGVTYTSVVQDITGILASAKQHGIPSCYETSSVPLGSVDFTVQALAISHSHCDAVVSPMVDSSDIGLATALRNAGVSSSFKQVYATGYDQTVLSNPSAVSVLNGAYFASQINMTTPNAGTQAMLNALQKYDSSYKGGLPDYGTWTAYLSADLMIKGLLAAGQNAKGPAVTSALQQIKNYSGGGILPVPVSFTKLGATLPSTSCDYFEQLKSGKFVDTNNGQPFCGKVFVAG